MKKQEKGITLIALIITIVVLMVLAVVAISSIQNGGILRYAQNSATAYDKAQENELEIIGGYEEYLNNMGNDSKLECEHNWEYGTCTICKSNDYPEHECTDYGYGQDCPICGDWVYEEGPWEEDLWS